MTNPHDAYTGVDNEPISTTRRARSKSGCCTCRRRIRCASPTYTLFPKPDYFFSTTGANVSINSSFAYDHGYYSPNIDVTWVGIAGQGVAVNGVDGPRAR